MNYKIVFLIALFWSIGLVTYAGHDDHVRQFRFKQQLDAAIFASKDALSLADHKRVSEFCNRQLDNMLSNPKSVISDYMDEVLYKYWENNTWVNESLEKLLFYNDINTETFTYAWDNGQWVNDLHSIITYDGEGRPISTLVQMWEPDGNEWVDMMLATLTWTAFNYPEEMIMQFNFGGIWMNFMRIAYTYNAQEQGTEVLMQDWDMMGSTWVNYARDLFAYNANGWMIEELSQDWTGSTWVDDEKGILTYEPNGNCTEKIKYLWVDNSWTNYLFFTYSYNVSWDLIEEKEEVWENGGWLNNWLYNYSYDGQGRLSEVLERNWEAKGWVNNAIELYTYGLPMSAKTKYARFDLTVFPNPATGYINISLTPTVQTDIRVRISDINGKLVEFYQIDNLSAGHETMLLHLPGLATGCYLLTIMDDQNNSIPVKLFIRN